MKTIKGQLDGATIELQQPEPMQQDGKWWEFNEYHLPVKGEVYYLRGGILTAQENHLLEQRDTPLWIAAEIPTPTPEQLKVIGKKCKHDRPMECKADDIIWEVHQAIMARIITAQDLHRWILEDVPNVEPEYLIFQTDSDEVIKRGDEYFDFYIREWQETMCPGTTVKSQGFTYRRKIQPPAKPEERRFTIEEIMPIVRGAFLQCDTLPCETLCQLIQDKLAAMVDERGKK